jgi:hypothetical protein
LGAYSDAARRISDAVTLAIVAGSAGKWMRFRLADGTSDDKGQVYDSKRDAMRTGGMFQRLYLYVQIPPDSMSPRQAEIFLNFNRGLAERGMQMTDPDDDREIVMPASMERMPRWALPQR